MAKGYVKASGSNRIHPDRETGARASESPMADLTLFRPLPYFACLNDETLAQVVQVAIQRTYKRGQIIFSEGEPCAGLCIVLSGRVKVFKVSLEGREQVLHVLGPGKTFNDVAVFDGGPNPANVVALDQTTLAIVDRISMIALVHRYPVMAMAVVERLAAMARHLVSLVETLSFCDVTGRLARLLLSRAQDGDAEVELGGRRWMSQEEMATHLGTVREMVGRSLRTLEEEGWIEIEHRCILIRDVEGLKSRAMM
jgi:CRP/FNR family cyclic AMP-dependent transcriptional regulator